MKIAKNVSIVLMAILFGSILLPSRATAAEFTPTYFQELKASIEKSTSKSKIQPTKKGVQNTLGNNLLTLTSSELITNGDFESSPFGVGWFDPNYEINEWGYSHSGTVSAYLGFVPVSEPISIDGISQGLFVPYNAVSSTFSFWMASYTFETIPGNDSITIVVVDSDNNDIYCSGVFDPVDGVDISWNNFSCDISSARGHNVSVIFIVKNNWSNTTSAIFDDVSIISQLDETPPTTTASISPVSPDGLNGWYTTPPMMTLSADDGFDGIGVWGTLYNIGDSLGEWDLYSTPVQLPDGNYSVYYASVDYGVNLEGHNSFSIKVDSAKPVLALNGSSNIRVVRDGIFADPGAVATDALDPSVSVIATGSVDTATLGDYVITYNATDQAGNVALPLTRIVSVVEPSDLSALTAGILVAQTIYDSAVEGSIPGQHVVGSKVILQSAINTAQGITIAYSQVDVDAAVVTLNSAVTTFNLSIVPPSNLTALSAIISTAQTTYNNSVEGSMPGQYPAPLKANLLAAINTALAITSAQAQSVVDAAIAPLNSAIATFLAGVVPAPPPAPPAPVVTPPAPIVTPPAPVPQVLGATTTRPIMKGLTVTKGAFSFKLNGVAKKIYPFGKTYKGTVWGKSVDFGPDGKFYVFVNTQAYSKGQIRVYRSDGKLLKAYNPYGGFATNGLNVTAVVESNDKVYLAVATTKAGTSVKTYELTAKGLTTLGSLKATKSAGNLKVVFKKLYKTQYGLVTMKEGDRSTLKVWKLNHATNKFVEDKNINKTKISI